MRQLADTAKLIEVNISLGVSDFYIREFYEETKMLCRDAGNIGVGLKDNGLVNGQRWAKLTYIFCGKTLLY